MMIVLSGPSSVGKTTLLRDWCNIHTEYKKITEVAREVMKERSITRTDLKLYLNNDSKKFLDFQQAIFEEQNCQESRLVGAGCSFIADRGPDPLVFVMQGIDRVSAMKLADTEGAKLCLERYRSKNCIVVVVCPLEEIEDDNVRMVPTAEEQLKYNRYLQEILQDLKIPFKYCDETCREKRVHWLEKVVSESQTSHEF